MGVDNSVDLGFPGIFFLKGFEICGGGTELILHVLSQNTTVAQRIGSPKSSRVTAEKKNNYFFLNR